MRNRASSRVGIGAFFSDTLFPRFHIEVGRQWDQRPGDILSGLQTMGGASVDGDEPLESGQGQILVLLSMQ